MIQSYLTYLIIVWAVTAIGGLALNLVVGWLGMVNLAQVGVMTFAAYAMAIVSVLHGYSLGVGCLVGLFAAIVAGFGLACLTRIVKGEELQVLLMGVSFVAFSLAINLTSLTRGPLGIPGIPRLFGLVEDRWFLLLTLATLIVVSLLVSSLVRSPFGRVMGSLRDDELHARVLGKRASHVKYVGILIASFIAALAAILQVQLIRFLDPATFFLPQQLFLLSVVFLGGLASVRGTLVGAAIMTFLPEVVRFIPGIEPTSVGAWRGIIFSALLLFVVLERPKGLFGTVELPSSYVDRD